MNNIVHFARKGDEPEDEELDDPEDYTGGWL